VTRLPVLPYHHSGSSGILTFDPLPALPPCAGSPYVAVAWVPHTCHTGLRGRLRITVCWMCRALPHPTCLGGPDLLHFPLRVPAFAAPLYCHTPAGCLLFPPLVLNSYFMVDGLWIGGCLCWLLLNRFSLLLYCPSGVGCSCILYGLVERWCSDYYCWYYPLTQRTTIRYNLPNKHCAVGIASGTVVTDWFY